MLTPPRAEELSNIKLLLLQEEQNQAHSFISLKVIANQPRPSQHQPQSPQYRLLVNMAAPRIRVGLMGASGSNPHAWANSTHLPYLLSGAGQKKYELVAICNSSIAAAEAVVAAYKLPAKTKVYGSPAALATDPDVDFVVVSVNVATHYDLVKPALEAGKMAYVEWPLARNIDEAEELAALAEKKGVKTVVGLQGRVEPLVDTIRGIVESGRIGGVLSSTVVAAASQMAPVETQGMAYFLDSKVGGSIVSIHFGHCKPSPLFLLDRIQWCSP